MSARPAKRKAAESANNVIKAAVQEQMKKNPAKSKSKNCVRPHKTSFDDGLIWRFVLSKAVEDGELKKLEKGYFEKEEVWREFKRQQKIKAGVDSVMKYFHETLLPRLPTASLPLQTRAALFYALQRPIKMEEYQIIEDLREKADYIVRSQILLGIWKKPETETPENESDKWYNVWEGEFPEDPGQGIFPVTPEVVEEGLIQDWDKDVIDITDNGFIPVPKKLDEIKEEQEMEFQSVANVLDQTIDIGSEAGEIEQESQQPTASLITRGSASDDDDNSLEHGPPVKRVRSDEDEINDERQEEEENGLAGEGEVKDVDVEEDDAEKEKDEDAEKEEGVEGKEEKEDVIDEEGEEVEEVDKENNGSNVTLEQEENPIEQFLRPKVVEKESIGTQIEVENRDSSVQTEFVEHRPVLDSADKSAEIPKMQLQVEQILEKVQELEKQLAENQRGLVETNDKCVQTLFLEYEASSVSVLIHSSSEKMIEHQENHRKSVETSLLSFDNDVINQENEDNLVKTRKTPPRTPQEEHIIDESGNLEFSEVNIIESEFMHPKSGLSSQSIYRKDELAESVLEATKESTKKLHREIEIYKSITSAAAMKAFIEGYMPF